jgi:hypothetical protein
MKIFILGIIIFICSSCGKDCNTTCGEIISMRYYQSQTILEIKNVCSNNVAVFRINNHLDSLEGTHICMSYIDNTITPW